MRSLFAVSGAVSDWQSLRCDARTAAQSTWHLPSDEGRLNREIMAPSVFTAANGNVRVQLRGFERMYTPMDNSSTKIVHVMVVRGAVTTLIRHLPTALMHTFNLHPRMRALQVSGSNHEAEIQPPISVNDVATRRLLRVRPTTAEEEASCEWKHHAQAECEIPVNRYEEFASFLEVWVDEVGNMARLFLFSDHYMCDGTAGMTILDDTLEHAAMLAKRAEIEPKQHPVRASAYNLRLDPYTFSTPLSELAVWLLSSYIKGLMVQHTKPLLPARFDQADLVYPFKNNPSYAMFESGDPDTVKKVLARCKEESVTYTGAITAAVILACYRASQRHRSVALTDSFKVVLNMSTNLRTRFPEPPPEDVVASYASGVDLHSLKDAGVIFSTAKFWDVARGCKQEIETELQSPLVALTDIFLDQTFSCSAAPTAFAKHAVKHSRSGDVNISNIGRYPHKLVHSLGDAGDLSIESLFLCQSAPFLCAGSLMYVATTKTFNYSMMHKLDDDDAAQLFNAYVAFAEAIGDIVPNATMADVLAQVEPALA